MANAHAILPSFTSRTIPRACACARVEAGAPAKLNPRFALPLIFGFIPCPPRYLTERSATSSRNAFVKIRARQRDISMTESELKNRSIEESQCSHMHERQQFVRRIGSEFSVGCSATARRNNSDEPPPLMRYHRGHDRQSTFGFTSSSMLSLL